jgi:hypothetical protein
LWCLAAQHVCPLAWRRYTRTALTTHLTSHACARCVDCPSDTLPAAERPNPVPLSPSRGLTGQGASTCGALRPCTPVEVHARPARHAACALCAAWRARPLCSLCDIAREQQGSARAYFESACPRCTTWRVRPFCMPDAMCTLGALCATWCARHLCINMIFLTFNLRLLSPRTCCLRLLSPRTCCTQFR